MISTVPIQFRSNDVFQQAIADELGAVDHGWTFALVAPRLRLKIRSTRDPKPHQGIQKSSDGEIASVTNNAAFRTPRSPEQADDSLNIER